MNARTDPSHARLAGAVWQQPDAGLNSPATRAPGADDLPAMALVDTLTVGDARIPVWQAVDDDESVPDGKFVCFRDMPAELAAAFRERQVWAGHPFAGAAYIEDFELFLELRRC